MVTQLCNNCINERHRRSTAKARLGSPAGAAVRPTRANHLPGLVRLRSGGQLRLCNASPVGTRAREEVRAYAPRPKLRLASWTTARRARFRAANVKRFLIFLGVASVVALGAFVLSNDVFVVQPIGAVPDGVTLIVSKKANIRFIDSADALCDRELGGVSLLCRSMVLAVVLDVVDIRARLPYMDWLYLLSTGGKRFAQ